MASCLANKDTGSVSVGQGIGPRALMKNEI